MKINIELWKSILNYGNYQDITVFDAVLEMCGNLWRNVGVSQPATDNIQYTVEVQCASMPE